MQIDRATLSSLLSSPVTYVRNATKIYDKKNSRIISRMRPIKEMIEHPPRAGLVSRNEGVLLLDEELFLALVFWGCSIASPSVQSATDLANRRHRDCGLTAKLSWNVTSFSRSQLLRVPPPPLFFCAAFAVRPFFAYRGYQRWIRDIAFQIVLANENSATSEVRITVAS